MKHAALIFVAALAGCVEAPRECWRGDIPECEIGGNAGDGVAAAPDAPEAPEPAATPAPAAKPDRPAPAPAAPTPAPEARPEKPDKPKPAPEPEKPSYADWSQPGDDEIFDVARKEGYTEAEIAMKQMALAGQRAAAEADAKAQAGGFNR